MNKTIGIKIIKAQNLLIATQNQLITELLLKSNSSELVINKDIKNSIVKIERLLNSINKSQSSYF